MGGFPQQLREGYADFRAGKLASDAATYRELAEEGQKPKVMVIGCADSRATPEAIFNAGPGDLFIVRNVANVVGPKGALKAHSSVSAAVEFAVLYLGVEHIVVMGHARCGGISAVVNGAGALSDDNCVGQWLSQISDVTGGVERAGMDDAAYQTAVEQANVQRSLEGLRSYDWISAREQDGRLALHGAWFDIADGTLKVLEGDGSWAVLA